MPRQSYPNPKKHQSPIIPKSPQWHGIYPGKVETLEDDPKGDILCVKVRVFEVFSEDIPADDLPWAVYQLPTGARENEGVFIPVQVGDIVEVRFPWRDEAGNGDTTRPMITGSMHYAPDGKPRLPHEAWDGPDKIEHKRRSWETTPEPPEYHKPAVFSQHGILIEISPDKSFCLTHKDKKTAVHIDPDGNITLHSEKNIWISATENARVEIDKDSKIEIDGKSELKIGKTSESEIGLTSERKIGLSETVDVKTTHELTAGLMSTTKAPRIHLNPHLM